MREQTKENFNVDNKESCKSEKEIIYKRKHQISNHPHSPKEKEKNNKKLLLLLLLLLLLFLFVIFLCLFFLLNKKKKNFNDEDNIINNIKKIKCEEDEDNICLDCGESVNCEPGYELVCGRCIKYSFKSTYITKSENENISLISNLPNDIIEMTVDGKKELPAQNFIFPFAGKHTVYILINITNNNSLSGMFSFNKMTSIFFNSNFNTENIEDMEGMFGNCDLLTSINISSFNTQKVHNMEAMFYCCSSLINIDFSNLNLVNLNNTYKFCYWCTSLTFANFSNSKILQLKRATGMFDNCHSLTSLDFSSFNNQNMAKIDDSFIFCPNLTYIDISSFICNSSFAYNIFLDLPNFGTIKLKNSCFTELEGYIPETWNRIILD